MSAGPARVLVVDDDPINRMMLSMSLAKDGHVVLEAENGRRGLETLAAEPVDVVLLDMQMPEVDGFAVLERRRGDPRLREIPVIVISGLDEMESVIRCIELGAEDFLPKPFDPVLLRARIGASLEKKRLHDQKQAHLATIESQAAQLARQAAELAEWNRRLEERVRQQVEQMERLGRLRRFLSPQLVEAIISSGDESVLESHRREVTVVFCDLRGFSAFAETAEPEDVMQVLREYHATLGPLVFQFEGTLERFTGDGMMVFFNDPIACDDPAWRAVQMAVAMRRAVADLTARWRRRGHDLDFGVGIAVGYATCGRIGFEGRFDYGAIGTVTNLAARLCGEARPGQILASQRVYTSVEGMVQAEPVGALTLKGFVRPIPAFNILDIHSPAEASKQL